MKASENTEDSIRSTKGQEVVCLNGNVIRRE
jgi:hypothetical protein